MERTMYSARLLEKRLLAESSSVTTWSLIFRSLRTLTLRRDSLFLWLLRMAAENSDACLFDCFCTSRKSIRSLPGPSGWRIFFKPACGRETGSGDFFPWPVWIVCAAPTDCGLDIDCRRNRDRALTRVCGNAVSQERGRQNRRQASLVGLWRTACVRNLLSTLFREDGCATSQLSFFADSELSTRGVGGSAR